jgi:predicted GH43/DUF377 family glycosyl hydrolase
LNRLLKVCWLAVFVFGSIVTKAQNGSQIVQADNVKAYSDNRPTARYRLNATDAGIVLKYGTGPDSCDYLGTRDIWVFEADGKYYMHYDGAGKKGWLACRATSTDLVNWITEGPVLDYGAPGTGDSRSASYGTTFFDGTTWHMFYLGTPHVSEAPNFVPSFPYLTMKAESKSPTGPWKKRYDVTPFTPQPGTYYSATASPGFIVKERRKYVMFFSASTANPIYRTLSAAYTKNLDGPWKPDKKPIVPLTEQVENSSLYYEPTNKTWFIFTNHIGIRNGLEYTDAIWVYWSRQLNKWNPKNKAIVLDTSNCNWSKNIIGLPSVIKVGRRLAIFYDGNILPGLPAGSESHMQRDVGLAWLDLPLNLPVK